MADIIEQRKKPGGYNSGITATDLPKYEKRTGYIPQAGPTGLGQAISGTAQNYSELANIGAQAAGNAATELSTIQAARDAQTPGRNLAPAFTLADKTYQEAYHKEEYANLASKGQEMVSNNLALALRNPTADSLASFEKQTGQALMSMAGSATEVNQRALGRDLGHAYTAAMRQLGNAVYQRNEQLNAEAYAARYEQGEREVYNYVLNGQEQEASYVKQKLIEDAENQKELGKISEREVNNKKLVLELKEEEARESWEFQQAEKAGMGDKYLAWLKNENEKELSLPPKPPLAQGQKFVKRNLAPDVRNAANAAAYKYANQFRAFTDGLRQLEYQRASHAIQEGSFQGAELFALKDKLDAARYENIRHQFQMQQLKQDAGLELANVMKQNFNSVSGMTQFSAKEKDEVFDGLVETQEKIVSAEGGRPYKASLVDQATMALQIKSDIPALQNRISQSVKYGNPQQMMQGSQAIRILENNNNGIGAKGIDADTRAIASLFDLTSRYSSRTPEDAATFARDYVVNATPEQKQERIDNYNSWKKEKEFDKNPGDKLKFIAEGLNLKSGFIFKTADKSKVPLGMSSAFDTLMPLYVSKVGDPDLAAQEALKEMRQVFSDTKVNNSDEIMKYPPDKIFEGVPLPLLNRSKEIALSQVVDRNRNLKEHGNFVFQDLLAINNSKHDEDGNLYVEVNGKKAKVIIQTDYMTELGANLLPSWSFAVIPEGTNTPIPLMDNVAPGAQARWAPTPLQFRTFATQEEIEYLNKAQQIKDWKDALQELSNNKDAEVQYWDKLREGPK